MKNIQKIAIDFITSRSDRFWAILGLVMLCFVAYMAGAICTYNKIFPYSLVANAQKASAAVKQKQSEEEKLLSERIYIKPGSTPKVLNTDSAIEGYTLYTLRWKPGALLVDMQGNIVYKWDFVGDSGKNGLRPHWRDVELMPDGGMLVTLEGGMTTPYGQGLRKIDSDGRIIWRNDAGVNHLINIAKDGTITGLCHKVSDSRHFNFRISEPKLLEDSVCIFDKNGKMINSASLLRLLLNGGYTRLIASRHGSREWDVLHSNSAMTLEPDMAQHFPMYNPGDVLVSVRSLSALLIVDMQKKKISSVIRGPWKMQHDAKFMPDGTIYLFDNRGPAMERSRVASYNPATNETKTVFGMTPHSSFYSSVMGAQQPLENGHLLATITEEGRIIEFNEKGDIVWDYRNPFVSSLNRQVEIMAAKRYPISYFDKAFLNKLRIIEKPFSQKP